MKRRAFLGAAKALRLTTPLPCSRGRMRSSSDEASGGCYRIHDPAVPPGASRPDARVSGKRFRRSGRPSSAQPERPVRTSPKRRLPSALEPEEAAQRAIAHRAKPGAPAGHVRLVLTLDLRRGLAEQLSATAIRSGRNLEAVVIDMLESGAQR